MEREELGAMALLSGGTEIWAEDPAFFLGKRKVIEFLASTTAFE